MRFLVLKAIRQVLGGKVYLSEGMSGRLLKNFTGAVRGGRLIPRRGGGRGAWTVLSPLLMLTRPSWERRWYDGSIRVVPLQ